MVRFVTLCVRKDGSYEKRRYDPGDRYAEGLPAGESLGLRARERGRTADRDAPRSCAGASRRAERPADPLHRAGRRGCAGRLGRLQSGKPRHQRESGHERVHPGDRPLRGGVPVYRQVYLQLLLERVRARRRRPQHGAWRTHRPHGCCGGVLRPLDLLRGHGCRLPFRVSHRRLRRGGCGQ